MRQKRCTACRWPQTCRDGCAMTGRRLPPQIDGGEAEQAFITWLREREQRGHSYAGHSIPREAFWAGFEAGKGK